MRLTPNFKLSEFERSATAKSRGFDNSITDPAVKQAIEALTVNVLQPIRDHFGKPIRINSGYRGLDLNASVGGSKTSQHCKGEAADIEIDGLSNRKLAEWIRDNLEYDQLILEGHTPGIPNSGWVHVSFCAHSARHSVLTAEFKVVDGKKTTTYKEGLNV